MKGMVDVQFIFISRGLKKIMQARFRKVLVLFFIFLFFIFLFFLTFKDVKVAMKNEDYGHD